MVRMDLGKIHFKNLSYTWQKKFGRFFMGVLSTVTPPGPGDFLSFTLVMTIFYSSEMMTYSLFMSDKLLKYMLTLCN